jgi:hypothetical protein
MGKYHYVYGYYKKRHLAFDVIGAVFFGCILFFATIVGNVASYYISKVIS